MVPVRQPARSRSLLKDYLLYVICIVAAVVVISIGFTWRMYEQQQSHLVQDVDDQTAKLERQLADALDFIAYITETTARQLSVKDAANLNEVQKVIDAQMKVGERNFTELTTTMINWAGPDNIVSIRGTFGQVHDKADLSSREYMKRTRETPGKLLFSPPAEGVASRKMGIPAGVGVVGPEGQYLGTVAVAIDISGLTNKLEQSATLPNLRFTILTQEGEHIASSPDEWLNVRQWEAVRKHLPNIRGKQYETVIQRPSLLTQNNDLIVMHALDRYPFVVLASLTGQRALAESHRLLVPRIVEFGILGVFLILVLTLLRQRIITPIITLSNAADKISHGDTNITLPESSITEIATLSEHISRIGGHLRERKIVEQELRAKTHELRTAKDSAEKANKGKSEFLAFLSHEVRTPLNAILAFSEIMKTQAFGPINNEKYVEYAGDIHRSGEFILGILNDLLDITRAEAGLVELHPEYLDIHKLVREAVRLVEERAEAGSINLVTKLEKDLPALYADAVRLKQVLLNVLTNAVKFTPKGGTVTLEVRVGATKKNALQSLEFIISDTGIGMAKKDIPVALQKFGQVNHGKAIANEGVGLGLPLTKHLVELHGATFDLASTLNEGTVITITFPTEKLKKI